MIYVNTYIRNEKYNTRYIQFPVRKECLYWISDDEPPSFFVLEYKATGFINLDGKIIDHCYVLTSYPDNENIKIIDNYYEFIKTFIAEPYYRKR